MSLIWDCCCCRCCCEVKAVFHLSVQSKTWSKTWSQTCVRRSLQVSSRSHAGLKPAANKSETCFIVYSGVWHDPETRPIYYILEDENITVLSVHAQPWFSALSCPVYCNRPCLFVCLLVCSWVRLTTCGWDRSTWSVTLQSRRYRSWRHHSSVTVADSARNLGVVIDRRQLSHDGGSCFGHLSVWLLSNAPAASCRPISHSRRSQDDCACFRCM